MRMFALCLLTVGCTAQSPLHHEPSSLQAQSGCKDAACTDGKTTPSNPGACDPLCVFCADGTEACGVAKVDAAGNCYQTQPECGSTTSSCDPICIACADGSKACGVAKVDAAGNCNQTQPECGSTTPPPSCDPICIVCVDGSKACGVAQFDAAGNCDQSQPDCSSPIP